MRLRVGSVPATDPERDASRSATLRRWSLRLHAAALRALRAGWVPRANPKWRPAVLRRVLLAQRHRACSVSVLHHAMHTLSVPAAVSPLPTQPTRPSSPYQVKLQSAAGLRKADLFGKSDPYCVGAVGDSAFKSGTRLLTLDPQWNETFQVYVASDQQVLKLNVRSPFPSEAVRGCARGRMELA